MTRLVAGVAAITRLSPVSDGSQSPGPGPPQPSPGVQRRSWSWPRLLDTPLTFTITDKIFSDGSQSPVPVQPSPGVQRNRGSPSPGFIKENNHNGFYFHNASDVFSLTGLRHIKEPLKVKLLVLTTNSKANSPILTANENYCMSHT